MSYSRLRKGRVSEQGRAYFITTVTASRVNLFEDWRCARLLVREMRTLHEAGVVQSIAWVVMPDHLHWLFVLQEGCIGAVMKLLKGRSARKLKPFCAFKSVWQPAYYDQALRDNQDLKTFARYIVANPLRAGLVKRMGDYPHWDAEWL